MINRREFIAFSVLATCWNSVLFAKSVRDDVSGLTLLVDKVRLPFNYLAPISADDLRAWLENIPEDQGYSTVKLYMAKQIKKDYLSNNVKVVNGVILSYTEFMIYSYKYNYA